MDRRTKGALNLLLQPNDRDRLGCNKQVYIRPVSMSTTTTTSTNPKPPLGPYPHARLCGQAGMLPANIKIKTTKRMVPRVISIPFSADVRRASVHQ